MTYELKLQHQLAPQQIDQLVELYQHEWWTKGRERTDVEIMVSASDLLFVYVDQSDVLCAFARVLTDKVYKAFIFDVIVRQAFRGEGVGDRIVSDIKSHPELARVRHIELYCKPELQTFYSRHGFSSETGGIVLMRAVAANNSLQGRRP